MGLLDSYFRYSPPLLFKPSAQKIVNIWNDYLLTLDEKKKLLEQHDDQIGSKLLKVLNSELIDINTDDKISTGEAAALHNAMHSRRIQHVPRLVEALHYVDTKYEFIHALLSHLYATLAQQLRIAKRLQNEYAQQEITSLAKEIAKEREIVQTIVDLIPPFQKLLVDIIQQTYVVEQLNDHARELYAKYTRRLIELRHAEVKEGESSEEFASWLSEVTSKVTFIAERLHEDGTLEREEIPTFVADFWIVNGPTAPVIIADIMEKVSKRPISEAEVKAFTAVIREYYNYMMAP
jgi:hypothetical protein